MQFHRCKVSIVEAITYQNKNADRFAVLTVLWFFITCFFFVTLENSYGDVTIVLVKGCKFWLMLGTCGHWAVRHKYCDTGHPFTIRGPLTLTPIAERLAVQLSLRLRSVPARIRTPNLELADERSNRLRHRRGDILREIPNSQMNFLQKNYRKAKDKSGLIIYEMHSRVIFSTPLI